MALHPLRLSVLLPSLLALCLGGPALAAPPPDILMAPGADTYPDDDGIWVRKHLRFVLDPQGRVARDEEQALKMLTGHVTRQDMLDPRISWNDTRAELFVDEVVTWMVDGTEVRAQPNSMVPNTPGVMQWAVPYANIRELVVAHVGVEHGSTSLLRYRVVDRVATGLPFWGDVALRDFLPALSQQVVFEVPEGTELHYGVLGGELEPTVSNEGGLVSYVFKELGVPGVNLSESHEGIPRLVWSAAADWGQVRSFLEGRVEPAMAPGEKGGLGEAGAAKVEEILDGSLSSAERLARLHHFVADAVRTVDWPIRDFDYAVRPASQVLDSSIGHPLDKAVLLCAMLRQAGFESVVALASSQRSFLPLVPSPTPFDQVWVRVGQGPHFTWLDPVAHRDARNAYHLAGHPVLLLDGQASAPVLLPELSVDGNRASLLASLELAVDGDQLLASGYADLDLSGRYNPLTDFDRGSDRLSGVAGGLGGFFGGGQSEVFVGTRSCKTTALRAQYADGQLQVPDSGLVRLDLPRPPGAISAEGLEMFRVARSLPISLPAPASEVAEIRILLPEGFEPVWTPADVELSNGLGSYVRTVQWEEEEARLLVRSELTLLQPQVLPGAWPDLRALFSAMEGAHGDQVLLRRQEAD